MNASKIKKALLRAIPYILFGLLCSNIGEAWRLSYGADAGKRLLSFFGSVGPAFANPLPSLYLADLLVGAICGCVLRFAVYLRGKNAKHFKHNQEYGSARWGAYYQL